MSKVIRLKKGFDINLAGKPEPTVEEPQQPETFALKPTDFIGMARPKVLVEEGAQVKAGTPIMIDKWMDQVLYTAPVSGEVVEVKRGAKRKLLEIKILADKDIQYEAFTQYSASDLQNVEAGAAKEQLLKSGLWPHIIQRPYGVVANPEDTPKNIFISTFDTSPLAPDFDLAMKGQEANFQAGVTVLSRLTTGQVHVGVNGKKGASPVFGKVNNAQVNTFTGKHPVGNVGVQIHHVAPVNKGEVVWTVHPVAVAQIGSLFLNGKLDTSRTIAVTGSEVAKPHYVKTFTGAAIKPFVEGKLKQEHVRYVSGNVLTGERIEKEGYLGFYHYQLTILPEGDDYELLGWIKPTNKLSYHRAFGLLSFLSQEKERVVTTNTHGEERAFVMTGAFEEVTPMDVLPTYLIKAIQANDYDEMEALGIYEVIEEDLALCEFIDVSKHDIQAILREGLDMLRNS